MSQEAQSAELRAQSQKLVDGPLKHIRAAALAAALVPLASVMATPASAQTGCLNSGGVCGFMFNDSNHDGIMQSGETPLEGVPVTIVDTTSGNTITVFTDSNGYFEPAFGSVFPNDVVTITVPPPTGTQISPAVSPGSCLSICNGGTLQNGVSTINTTAQNSEITNFGFFQNSAANPGTGTIGYWKNHPGAWPPAGVPVAGVTYTAATAIPLFNKVGKDKSYMMFAQLVAAELSVMIGNDSSCIAPTITAANNWLLTYGIGTNVAGASQAWSGSGMGGTIETTLDNYNNGLLCAPHRQ